MKMPKFKALPKSPTGIRGFDEITFGGLPKGRPTLICGGPGCGKTLFAMQFIVNGINYKEPGVFISFEESPKELIQNVSSLGINLQALIKKKLLSIDYIHVEKQEILETGEFNLDGLFIRLEYSINSIGAKRIALDTIESLFSGISNHAILRAELRRLFRWLKDKGVTAVITGESSQNNLTRQGLEEYTSDCVIFLDNRVIDQYSTRRLRIIKYRGSNHGENEYPFLVDNKGISVLPISSLKLQHKALTEQISTGVPSLDEMFGNKGYYRGTSILVSGTAGSGKTSIAATFVDSCCRRGEKCIYIALEESKSQIMRNMNSIGLNLQHWEKEGLLSFHVTRPTYFSLEMHLLVIHKLVNEFHPQIIVIDPISNFTSISSAKEANSILTRLIDFLKIQKITALFTNLIVGENSHEHTEVGISSLIDSWISLFDVDSNGERNHLLYIVKSRGMSHSNQIREFLFSAQGIQLIDVYVGKNGIIIGSERKAQENIDRQILFHQKEDKELFNKKIAQIEKIAGAKIEAIKSEYEAEILELKRRFKETQVKEKRILTAYEKDAYGRQSLSEIKKI